MRRIGIYVFALVWLAGTFMISLRLFSGHSSTPQTPIELSMQTPVAQDDVIDDVVAFHVNKPLTTLPGTIVSKAKSTIGQPDVGKLRPHDVPRSVQMIQDRFLTRNRIGWEKYFGFKRSGRDGVWPTVGETEDRILNQIHLVHPDPTGKKPKKILMYGGLDPGMQSGPWRFIEHKCPINQCELTDNRNEAESADAVLFKEFVINPTFTRPQGQIWVLFLLESAVSRPSLQQLENKINWTATYRSDSTIVTPYERFTFFDDYTSLPKRSPKDYAAGKTKQVAWFVSNCAAANGRHNYVRELRKYIDVDIYGACGPLSCHRGTKECDRKLQQYKFYLAFENSNCIDYITEKMYWNAFGQNLSDPNNVVPIVMGARPEDYARLAPPNSYIHVDDFESPKALADYLHKVDQDDELYNSYFRWKGTGNYIDTKFWCRLCAMVHEAHRTNHHMVYHNLNDWWRGSGVCVYPSGSNDWSTWRNFTEHFDSKSSYFHSWVAQNHTKSQLSKP